MQLFVRDLNGCSVAVVADAQQNVGQLKVRASFSPSGDFFGWNPGFAGCLHFVLVVLNLEIWGNPPKNPQTIHLGGGFKAISQLLPPNLGNMNQFISDFFETGPFSHHLEV